MTDRCTCFSLITLLIVANAFGEETSDTAEGSPAIRAFELRLTGKTDDAESLLASAIETDPEDVIARFELARVHFYKMELDRAVEEMEKVVKLDPDHATYHYFKGVAESYHAVQKAHDPQTRDEIGELINRARRSFRKAVQLDPTHRDARLQLINLCLKAPEPNGAGLAEAEELAKQAESLEIVSGAMARCMLLGNDAGEKQRRLWEKLEQERPDDPDVHEGLGRASLLLGDTTQAMKHLDQALSLDATRRALLLDLARHHFFAKQYDQAEQIAQRYVDSQPPPEAPLRAYATFMIAKIHKVQKQDEQAEQLLARAMKIDPHLWQTLMPPPAALFITFED